jgi:hypothetical protein
MGSMERILGRVGQKAKALSDMLQLVVCAKCSHSPQASAWGYGARHTHEPFQRFVRCANESNR